jgi:hypothetical protein
MEQLMFLQNLIFFAKEDIFAKVDISTKVFFFCKNKYFAKFLILCMTSYFFAIFDMFAKVFKHESSLS